MTPLGPVPDDHRLQNDREETYAQARLQGSLHGIDSETCESGKDRVRKPLLFRDDIESYLQILPLQTHGGALD